MEQQYIELKQLLFDSLNQFIQNAGAYLPHLIGAILLLLLGLFIAWGSKWLILRLGAGLDRVFQAMGVSSLNARLKFPVINVLGWLIYWVIILLFLRAALVSLKLPSLAEILGKVVTSLPSLIIASVIIFAGIIFGNSIRDKITGGGRSTGFRQAEVLGSIVRFSIIALAIIVGLAQIGLDVSLFEHILTILIAAIVGAVALAFGLGAGPTVSNIISARYVRKNYQVGQQININNIQGKVLEILPTGVVLETEKGRTFVPARVFDEEASVLLDDETTDDD